jgi:S1-C subfamily serine protease
MEKYAEACDAFRKVLEQNKLDPGELLPPPANTRLGVSVGGGGQLGPMVIREVAEKSRAERIGLQAGDVLRKVDGKEVASVAELRKVVAAKASGLVVEVTRDGDDVKLTEKEAPAEKKAGAK